MQKPFGLTGNIGCGKSTVAALLSKKPNIHIFDTDTMAKEAIVDVRFKKEIKEIFGNEVLINKKVSLKLLGKILFHDDKKRQKLEALIHPYVWSCIEKTMTDGTEETIYIVESALLYEVGWHKRCCAMIVASCDEIEQKRRLRENRKMRDEAIKARLSTQYESEYKEKRATFLVRTNCDLTMLERRADNLYSNLIEMKRSLH